MNYENMREIIRMLNDCKTIDPRKFSLEEHIKREIIENGIEHFNDLLESAGQERIE